MRGKEREREGEREMAEGDWPCSLYNGPHTHTADLPGT